MSYVCTLEFRLFHAAGACFFTEAAVGLQGNSECKQIRAFAFRDDFGNWGCLKTYLDMLE